MKDLDRIDICPTADCLICQYSDAFCILARDLLDFVIHLSDRNRFPELRQAEDSEPPMFIGGVWATGTDRGEIFTDELSLVLQKSMAFPHHDVMLPPISIPERNRGGGKHNKHAQKVELVSALGREWRIVEASSSETQLW